MAGGAAHWVPFNKIINLFVHAVPLRRPLYLAKATNSIVRKMGSMAQLPAMKTNPKFVFFTDFDGTIVRRTRIDT